MTAALLPAPYRWLAAEPAPRMLVEGLKTFGTLEGPGAEDNPVIMGWAKEVGVPRIADVFTSDAIAWCGLWMAVIAHRSAKPVNPNALWARSWLNWGNKVSGEPKLGDVLVFRRGETSGHVGLYVGEDSGAFHVLGGNQGDAVSIVRIARSRLLGARNHYAVGQPPNCRRVHLSTKGNLSTNES